MRPGIHVHRPPIVFERQLGERDSLHMRDTDRIECDVDATSTLCDELGVLAYSALVECVDFHDFSAPARLLYFMRDRSQLGARSTDEMNLRSSPRKSLRNRSSNDSASAINDCDPIFQRHKDSSIASPGGLAGRLTQDEELVADRQLF